MKLIFRKNIKCTRYSMWDGSTSWYMIGIGDTVLGNNILNIPTNYFILDIPLESFSVLQETIIQISKITFWESIIGDSDR